MPWQNEMTLIVRHLVNDLDSSNYTFTDDRLEESVLVSAQLASLEIDFESTYTIDVDSLTLSPDPTTSSDKDDSLAKNIKEAVTKESNRLDKIAELEEQVTELEEKKERLERRSCSLIEKFLSRN